MATSLSASRRDALDQTGSLEAIGQSMRCAFVEQGEPLGGFFRFTELREANGIEEFKCSPPRRAAGRAVKQIGWMKRFELGKLFVGLAIPLAGLGRIVLQEVVVANLRHLVTIDRQPANRAG